MLDNWKRKYYGLCEKVANRHEIQELLSFLFMDIPNEELISFYLSQKFTLTQVFIDVWKKRTGFIENGIKPADPIDIINLYSSLLSRKPSKEELNFYKTESCSVYYIFNTILSSDEYKEATSKTYNPSIIEKLSLLLSGEKKQNLCCQSSELTCSDMKLYIGHLLEEHINEIDIKISDYQDIKNIYYDLLGRFPTNEELGYFFEKSTINYVLNHIYNSEEYMEKCKIYNVETVIPKLILLLQGSDSISEEIKSALAHNYTIGHVTEKLICTDFVRNRIDNVRKIEKKDIINGFVGILGRFPTESEVDYYLHQGYELGSFLQTLLYSDEGIQNIEKKNDDLNVHYGITQFNCFQTNFDIVFDNSMSDVISMGIKEKKFLWDDEYNYIKLLPDTGFVLDIGANVGAISMIFGAKGWSGFCIEASKKNTECLKRSIYLNRYNFGVGCFAVSDATKKIAFMENGPWGVINNTLIQDDTNNFLQTFKSGSVLKEIQAYCLDDWEKTELRYIKKIDFIKMDIEGSEYSALQGMGEFLKVFQYPSFYSEVNGYNLFTYNKTPRQLFDKFREYGYMPYKLIEDQLKEFDYNNFQTELYDNYLFIHKTNHYFDKMINGRIVFDTLKVKLEILNILNNGWSQHIKYLLFALKDYPQFYNDIDIKEKLMLYSNLQDDKVINYALDWLNKTNEVNSDER